MPEFPLVSIVTPSFNQAAFIEETILSILEQDYPAIEYIIMDGNSTDGSQDIIRKYESRLAYWVSEPDAGQSDAINKGFARAQGDILTWICSDDTLLPGAVSTIVDLFYQHHNAQLIYGDAVNVDAVGEKIGIRHGAEFSVGAMLVDNLVPQPASFFTQEAWLRFGPLDTQLHYAMDRQFWLRLAGHAPMIHVPIMLATMRRHTNAKTERDRLPVKLEEKRILDAYFAQADVPPAALEMKSMAYGRLYYYLGMGYLQESRFIEANDAFKSALSLLPLSWRFIMSLAFLGSSMVHTNKLASGYPAFTRQLVSVKRRITGHV